MSEIDARKDFRIDDKRAILADIGCENLDIFYAQELDSFFTKIAQIDCADTQEAIKARKKEVFEEVKQIWGEEGLIHPKDLIFTLLSRRLAAVGIEDNDQNEAVFTTLKDLVNNNFPPESLTGSYDAKTAVPLITGLSHLYAQTVAADKNIPVTIIEGDYGNMGGTNGYFAKLLGNPTDQQLPFDCTDRAARIMANIVLNKLQEEYGEKGAVFAMRAGGDEIRLIVSGATPAQVAEYIKETVQPIIEEFTAELGLHDYDHLKYPNDEKRKGFYLTLGTASLSETGITPDKILQDAEANIKENKNNYARVAELIPEMANEIRQQGEQEGHEPARVDATIGREEFLAAIQKQANDKLKPSYVIEKIEENQKIIDEVINIKYCQYKPEEYTNIYENLPDDILGRFKIEYDNIGELTKAITNIYENLPDDILGRFKIEYDNIGELTKAILEKELSSEDGAFHFINNKNQQKIFENVFDFAANSYPAIDPVTGAFMERDLPKHAAKFAKDAELSHDGVSTALHVEFTNAAGYNKISHQHADFILKEEADIIRSNIAKAELDYVKIYHTGGGKFVLLVPPMEIEKIDKFKAGIKNDVENLNERNMYEFFTSKGADTAIISTVKNKDGTIAYNENSILGDVVHPKYENEKGIMVEFVQKELQLPPDKDSPSTEKDNPDRIRMGKQIFNLKQDAEAKMKETRGLDQTPSPNLEAGSIITRRMMMEPPFEKGLISF
jgi:GGDEF domain-containing protein